MKKRSNFTPMKRFHEILDNYGLKLMEVGTNHLRVFFGNRKLFDYYPLRMKLFDYRQWQQLTYPSVMDGTDKWETELEGIINSLMVSPQKTLTLCTRKTDRRSFGITFLNGRFSHWSTASRKNCSCRTRIWK